MDPTIISQWLALVETILMLLKQFNIIPPAPAKTIAGPSGNGNVDHTAMGQYLLAASIATKIMSK